MAYGYRRTRVSVVAIFVLLGALFFAAPKSSASVETNVFYTSINAQRVAVGLDPLQTNVEMTTLSESWAVTLATQGSLTHSVLSDGVTQNWKKLGENIGSGSSATVIAAALVASPTHLENMVDPAFTQVGIGVAYSGITMYVVEKFIQLNDGAVAKPIPTTTTVPPTTTLQVPLPPTTTTTTTTTLPPTTTKPEPTTTTTTQESNRSKVVTADHGLLKLLNRWINSIRLFFHKS